MSRDLLHDVAAEQATLGACLLSADAFDQVAGTVSPTDFYRPAHGELWQTLTTMRGVGQPVDPITVAAHLTGNGGWPAGVDHGYLHTLIAAVPTTASVGHYARQVGGCARRRQLMALAARLTQIATGGTDDALAHIAQVVAGIAAGDSGDRSTVVRLADVDPARITWIWQSHLPVGKVVLVDGDPGVGKSAVTLDLAARITTGRPMPDGAPCLRPGNVLVLSAEDGLTDTIRPRIDAAGGNPEQVYVMTAMLDADGKPRSIDLATDLSEIGRRVRQLGVVLIIVDPFMAYLGGGVNSHRDQDVRRVLAPLARITEETHATAVVVRHMNKTGGSNALYRGGGSIGIIGATRLAYLVAKDPEDDTLRVLAPTKCNIAAMPPALSCRLVHDELLDTVHVVWEGIVDRQANDLLAQPADPEERSERNQAAGWLADYLQAQGQPRSADVKRAAHREGLSEATLKRAAQRLSVVVEVSSYPRSTRWSLPPSAPVGSQSAQSAQVLQGEPAEPTVSPLRTPDTPGEDSRQPWGSR